MRGGETHLTRRPRALIVVENMPFPPDRRVWDEATSLRDEGYAVTVISPAGKHKWTRPFERLEGIDVYRFSLPENRPGVAGFVVEYALAAVKTFWLSLQVLRRGGFDVLQVCNAPDLFFLHGLFYKVAGKAFIFDQHDLAPELFYARFPRLPLWCRPLGMVLYLCEWLSYKAADVVMVTNETFRARAVRNGGVSPDRVFVVRNGPDDQRMRPVTPDPALKRGRPYLACYVGNMGPQDGVDLAVRAAHWIIHEAGRTDVTFAFLGDGDSLPALKELAAELGISDYLVFPGYVGSEELMRYLCSADVGLAPDPENGLNEHLTTVKVMEYMAARLPIVAFDLKETRFSAQAAALYACANDYREFGRLVLALLDDPARRKSLGEIGRRRVEEALCWQRSRPQFLAAYHKALTMGRNSSVALDCPAQPRTALRAARGRVQRRRA